MRFPWALVLATILVVTSVVLYKSGAGGPTCEPFIEFDRPAGSGGIYPSPPGFRGAQEHVVILLCRDDTLRGEVTTFENFRQEVKR